MPPATKAKDIFLEAVEKTDPEGRAKYLREACGDDVELLRHVESLIRVHFEPHSLLDQERIKPRLEIGDVADQTIASPSTERPGMQIGPYKLLQVIGEGGMGVVYMAEQSEPVTRRVALKIIKPGMDTRQVIARFEVERQALAMMDHPNIAKVFDAGNTRGSEPGGVSPGSPYFVMELVRGIPITKYCDEHQLTLRQRLELFLPVCQAVQHAHQKGIIHRDLKPTNVLVAQYDDKPVPKVIDFGVAKAAQKLTERTMFTEFGQVVGTVEYMSPEQAQLNQLDIDTRSDIYSLGVLLYELLTGCMPFDGKRLRLAAFDEMLRIIREEDPPKPSTRLSSAETLPSIAARRNVEPARLSRTIRGELDWIVMKALEKDRNRRYETANSFAQDLQHYLADEPVQACPPSAAYRLRKFARRNKGPVATAAIVVLTLIGGIVGTTFGLVQADHARKEETKRADGENRAKLAALEREAETNAVIDFLEYGVLSRRRWETEGMQGDLLLSQAIEAALPFISQYADRPLIEARLRLTLASAIHLLGEIGIATEQAEVARQLYLKHGGPDHPGTLASMDALADIHNSSNNELRQQFQEQSLTLRKTKVGQDHPDTLWNMIKLASSYEDNGREAQALQLREEALKLLAKRKLKLDASDPDQIAGLLRLADCYELLNRHEEELELCEQVLALQRAKLGRDHLALLPIMHRTAFLFLGGSRSAEALQLSEDVLQLCKTRLGPRHSRTIAAMDLVAGVYSNLGRNADAQRLSEECWAARNIRDVERGSPFTHFQRVADEYSQSGRFALAEVHYRHLLDCYKRQATFYPHIESLRGAAAAAAVRLGSVLLTLGRDAEAENMLIEARSLHEEGWSTHDAICHTYALHGKWEQAIAAGDRALELEPGVYDRWYQAAILHFKTGNTEAYRRDCRQMILRFCQGPDVDPMTVLYTAKACGLAPDSIAAISRIEQLTGRTVVAAKGQPIYPYLSLSQGLLEYRAGRHESAIQWLGRYRRADETGPLDVIASATLAMAHHRLGDADAAQKAVDEAKDIIERYMPDPNLGQRLAVADRLDWLYAQLLYQEAAEFLQGEKRGVPVSTD